MVTDLFGGTTRRPNSRDKPLQGLRQRSKIEIVKSKIGLCCDSIVKSGGTNFSRGLARKFSPGPRLIRRVEGGTRNVTSGFSQKVQVLFFHLWFVLGFSFSSH